MYLLFEAGPQVDAISDRHVELFIRCAVQPSGDQRITFPRRTARGCEQRQRHPAARLPGTDRADALSSMYDG